MLILTLADYYSLSYLTFTKYQISKTIVFIILMKRNTVGNFTVQGSLSMYYKYRKILLESWNAAPLICIALCIVCNDQ